MNGASIAKFSIPQGDFAYEKKTRLFVRLDARENINRQDYLMRIAEANGINGINELAVIYGVYYSKFCSMSADELNKLFRGEIAACETLDNGPQHGGGYARRRGWAKDARVCPYCIRENRPQFVMFNFAIPVLCPTHGELPIDVCPNCSERPNYLRAKINYCDCGFYFGDAKGHPRPPWLGKFYERFADWHYCLPKSYPGLLVIAKADWIAASDILFQINRERPVWTKVFIGVSDFHAIEMLLSKREIRRRRRRDVHD